MESGGDGEGLGHDFAGGEGGRVDAGDVAAGGGGVAAFGEDADAFVFGGAAGG